MADAVVPISQHLAYRWKTRPVTLPRSWLNAQQALGLNSAGFPHAFSFARRKTDEGWRTEVWLRFTGGLRLNLSADLGVWPKTFTDARGFAAQFAKDHGFTAREVKRLID